MCGFVGLFVMRFVWFDCWLGVLLGCCDVGLFGLVALLAGVVCCLCLFCVVSFVLWVCECGGGF